MGFGGAVSAMLTALKNNKRERKSTFELMKNNQSLHQKSNQLFFEQKATKQEIAEIRKTMQQENRKNAIIKIGSIALVALSILILLYSI